MELVHSSWLEIEEYLKFSDGIIIPTGSIEQHGPVGLIGTDTLCANDISTEAADKINALVAPALAYAPAEFNMAFAGTVSISVDVYCRFCIEVFRSFERHGFRHIYILNGHGANLEPLRDAADTLSTASVSIKSWWDFDPVKSLRNQLYSDWEGMHATPSEVAITQTKYRILDSNLALNPPEKLTPEFIKSHAGDKHGSAAEHRAQFPDGRVGSHSVLATPEKSAAVQALCEDYQAFLVS
jgi:creatinine amidohydrolase